jgi:hypothetical protein
VQRYRQWARRDYLAMGMLTDSLCAKATGRPRPAGWCETVWVTGSSRRFRSPGREAWSAGSGPRGRARSGWLAPASMPWQAAWRRTAWRRASRWTRDQLDDVRDQLHQRWQQWNLYQLGSQHSEDGQAHITARLVRVLPEIATWAASLPPGLVALEPWLTPAKGDRTATA